MDIYIYIDIIYSRGFAHAAALPPPLAPSPPLRAPGRLFGSSWGLRGGSLGAPGGSEEALGEVWEALGELSGTPRELLKSFCGALSGFPWSLWVPRDLYEASKKPPGGSQVSFWDLKRAPK